MDIFAEIMAFGEELDEVAQVLDEELAYLLPHAPFKFHHNKTPPKTPYHT